MMVFCQLYAKANCRGELAVKPRNGPKKAVKAAKEATNVTSATSAAEEAIIGKNKSGGKRKNPEEASEPKAKVTRMSEALIEDEITPEPWRVPTARMW
jgi:hypothetical protein